MPRKPKKEIAYLAEQEVDAFFHVIRNSRDKAVFRVTSPHGLRASEPGRLMFSDFRLGPGKPHLRVIRLKGSVTGIGRARECILRGRSSAPPRHATGAPRRLATAAAGTAWLLMSTSSGTASVTPRRPPAPELPRLAADAVGAWPRGALAWCCKLT
jgi:hypothetical protein